MKFALKPDFLTEYSRTFIFPVKLLLFTLRRNSSNFLTQFHKFSVSYNIRDAVRVAF